MQQVPSVKIKIADFDDSTRAHMIYSYANTVQNNLWMIKLKSMVEDYAC
jgi:hypothetical protein